MGAPGDTNAAFRILDVNANRAREAIRVLEEYARFVIEDPFLAGRCKELRHALQQVLTETPGRPLPLFRDTEGDIGTNLSTPAERVRTSAADVVSASANRLSEALRALEEYGKSLAVPFSQSIEKLRYECYTLTSHLIRRASGAKRFEKVRLYVLITEALCQKGWHETAEAALSGGAQALQLREKELSDDELFERAKKLRELCDGHDALLIINDRLDIALAAGAHGVHLGQDDLPVRAARRIMGPDSIIGLSTHSVEQAEQALHDPPDYLAVGPMFASSTKPQEHLAGPETLDLVRQLTSLPLVAVGGINARNAVLLQSADTLAVCSAIISASGVTQATREFLRTEVTANSG